MRTIGILVANRPECIVALDAAFALAVTTGADVQGYHMRPDRKASKNVSLGQLLLRDDTAAIWASVSPAEEKKAAISARELFARLAGKYGYSISKKQGTPGAACARFHEKTGSPEKLMPLLGPVNDLLVVSRPDTNKSAKAIHILRTSLLSSRVPVLVLPRKARNVACKHLVLAWNRGRAETVLMHNTLSLMQQAEQVTVLSVGRDHHHGPSAAEVVSYLKAHGIQASHKQVLSKDQGEGLVDTFKSLKGDMLLCGAYTRGHVRETIFGGMTRYLLEKTDVPVIFQHI